MEPGLKKIDKYIIKKFILTFFIALLLIIGIVIIFDISEKIDDFVRKSVPLREIAFDYYTTKRLLQKFQDWPEFGLNFDPSHLQWQGISPHLFLEDFIHRVYHVHMKDCAVTLNGRNSLLCSHIDFGDMRRGWNFRSLGHGDVNFEEIIRVLNAYNYEGPLSVEWEDSGMDREYGAREALEFVRKIDFKPSDIKFDSAIKS